MWRSANRVGVAAMAVLVLAMAAACGGDEAGTTVSEERAKSGEFDSLAFSGGRAQTFVEGEEEASGATAQSAEGSDAVASPPAPRSTPRVSTSAVGSGRVESEGLGFAGDKVDFRDAERVFFVSPKDGDDVTSPVQVKMGTEGLIVRRRFKPQDRYGHHHIFVDDTRVPGPEEKIQIDETHIHYHKIESSTLIDLEPGEHTLTLVFGNGFNFPYGFQEGDAPPLAQTITINVVGRQEIFFVEPEDDAAIRQFPFKVKVGSRGVDESSGHYVVVWGVYAFPPAGEPVPEDDNRIHLAPGETEFEMDIKAGGHKFTVLFVDDNNMLSDPPLTQSINIAAWKTGVKLEGISVSPGG